MLSQDLTRYIELHRSLGFKFRTQHTVLRNFVAFAETRGDACVRTNRVLDWAVQAQSPLQRRNRLLTVRRFAMALQAEDARHEIPAADALGSRSLQRRRPYIYAPDEIARLMHAAGQLKPSGSIKPLMYATLFGLLAATGMRISEALKLQLGDVTGDGLLIRETKFKKSRLLPLHDTTRDALDAYLSVRVQFGSLEGALFVSNMGIAPAYSTVVAIFLKLARSSGLRSSCGQPGPRIHDLRHTFAVRALEQCPGESGAIGRNIVALSTYLGHGHVTDTYWYLQATPILLAQVATAGETFYQEGVS